MSIDKLNEAYKIFDMREELLEMEKKALQDLEAAEDLTSLERFRITYLGKKGLIATVMKRLGELPAQEKPEAGELANRVKGNLSKLFEQEHNELFRLKF